MHNITILKADVSHAALLTELSLVTFREAFEKDNNPDDFNTYVSEAFNLAQITRDIEERGSLFYLVYNDGQPIAYARLRLSTEVNHLFPDQKIIELHRLYTRAAFTGKGIGKALINHCLMVAKENAFDLIWLGVWEHNLRAQAFYQNMGFEKFSSHVFMVGDDPQTDFLMKKNL